MTLCFQLNQTIAYIKNPPSKSASQYISIITADKSPPEKSKYGSYVRVLRRRRGLLCCN